MKNVAGGQGSDVSPNRSWIAHNAFAVRFLLKIAHNAFAVRFLWPPMKSSAGLSEESWQSALRAARFYSSCHFDPRGND